MAHRKHVLCLNVAFWSFIINIAVISKLYNISLPFMNYNNNIEIESDGHNDPIVKINEIKQSHSISITNHPYKDLDIQVINLINSKYAYTKRMNHHINISKVTPVQVSEQDADCMDHIKVGSHCKLNRNVSFIVNDKLGAGWQSNVYSVTVLSENNTDTFVLKQFHEHEKLKYLSNKPCDIYEMEYKLLKRIELYIKYYDIPSIGIPLLHPKISLYQTINHCLIFTQQIPNVISFRDTLKNLPTLLPSIIDIKGNIINFLMDCYNDIMEVFYILYQFGIYHNDMKPINLLIDTKTFKCYVIDFGYMFQEQSLLKCSANSLCWFSCPFSTCSPIAWHYLNTLQKRQKFHSKIKNLTAENKTKKLNATMMLSKFGIYSRQYTIATIIFHTFVRLYYLQMDLRKDKLFEMNEAIIEPYENMNKNEMWQNMTHFVWCTRYEIYLKILEKIKTHKHDMEFENNMHNFMNIISIISDDLLFLNSHNCKFLK